MHKNIQPIETVYNGYRFRSRLEARWAVFFDAIGIEYRYEPEGFELGEGLRYLPDFYVPEMDAYIEIKPFSPSVGEMNKFCLLASHHNKERQMRGETPCMHFIICGTPGNPQVIMEEPDSNGRSIMSPGDGYFIVAVSGHKHDKDDYFTQIGAFVMADGGSCFEYSALYFDNPEIRPPCKIKPKSIVHGNEPTLSIMSGGLAIGIYYGRGLMFYGEKLTKAYKAARQARFEHGESPKGRR